MLREIDFLL